MKTDKIELPSEIKMKTAKQMGKEELANWFAFVNGLKFLNLAEQRLKQPLHEDDITYKALNNYVHTTSGDILSCMHHYNGIPLKYSLDPSDDAAHQIDEVEYPY